MGWTGHSRNVIYGHLANGDVFNIGLWFDTAPSSLSATQTQATNFANAFAGKITTPPASSADPALYLNSFGGYDGLRVYSYLDETKKAAYVADAPINKVGHAGAASAMPPQAACVVTLKTGVAGRTATGRIYMPLGNITVTGSNGQMGTGDAQSIANWWSAVITAINAAAGTGHVCVFSRKTATSQSVNAVSVDTKIDIQRRRVNKEVPTNKYVVTVT